VYPEQVSRAGQIRVCGLVSDRFSMAARYASERAAPTGEGEGKQNTS
jgi:hypothetical protein